MSKLAKTQPSKGQTNLFSFFKKTPSDNNKVKPTPAKHNTDNSQTVKDTVVIIHEDGSALVNRRIKVWWPADKEWYFGTVSRFDAATGKHSITYEDGEVELLDLNKEKYSLVESCKDKNITSVTKRKSISVSDESDLSDDDAKLTRRKKNKICQLSDEEEEWNESTSQSSGEDYLEDSSESEAEYDSSAKRITKSSRLAKVSVGSKSKRARISDLGENSGSSRRPPIPKKPCSPANRATPSNTTYDMFKAGSGASTPSYSARAGSPSCTSTPVSSNTSPSPHLRLTASKASPVSSPAPALPEGVVGPGNHEHDSWEFLINRRDKNGHSPDHPDFNPRTILFPQSFLKQQTPAMRQWFEVKADYFDTVLFFKVGKFYELFHMDADIGVSEIDLIYMKGTKAHSGFPEVSYGKYASALVAKGYRVARVEQTETPEMLKERNRSAKKGCSARVVAREMCSIMSKGTRTFCHLDDLSILDDAATGDSSSLLLCVKERPLSTADMKGEDKENEAVVEYGLSFVNTILGTVTLAQFEDDVLRNRLRTAVARYSPTEILLEHGASSSETAGVLSLLVPGAVTEYLRNGEMPTATDTMKSLKQGGYFQDSSGNSDFPAVLNAVAAGLEDGSSELVMSALGGAVWYLKRAFIDFEVLSNRRVYAYVPPDDSSPMSSYPISKADGSGGSAPQWTDVSLDTISDSPETHGQDSDDGGRHMVMDAVTLANLEILVNNFDHTERGSLWSFMNRCRTPFGRRLLRDWVCKPLLRPRDIQLRTEAVDELMGSLAGQAEQVRGLLKNCPDLERLLGRVHSNGLKKKVVDHPDGRAIMYENQIYNSRKIRDFTEILKGFEMVVQVMELFQSDGLEIQSRLLRSLVLQAPHGRVPLSDMKRLLAHFREIFDERQAKADGFIRPRPGVDQQYDDAKADVADIERSFEEYLKEQKKEIGVAELAYFGSNKDRYQLEVPMSRVGRVPSSWSSKSQKKSHRRYWTPFIEENLALLTEAEDRLAFAQKDTMRRVFEKFDGSRNVWSAGMSCLAILDALLSLASVSSSPNYCWPTIVPRQKGNEDVSVLDIKGGRHAMLERMMAERGDGSFISNDLSLGGKVDNGASQGSLEEFRARTMLVSGPNMGGKSTLLRQTCLITIMAQIGCKVPADICILSPVDRIFTRIGASDRILSGQSTFFVELAETAIILKHATQDSLCILDELGRGTSTFDGTAIAHAVVEHIVSKIRCRTLFATHYHTLINDWSVDPRIRLGHMDCLVHTEDVETEQSSHTGGEEVTFLYRLCDGSSPRSYGINVARLARLPQEVLDIAYRQSREFEEKLAGKNSQDSYNALMTQFFERVVSALNSNMSHQEMHWVTNELWNRFVHVKSRTVE